MYNSIDIKDIDKIKIYDINDDYINKNVLIDIRDKYEYILDHINDSVNIPYNYLSMFKDKYLNFNDNYYIYCDSGIKSKKICIMLNELGYKTIDLIGGYKEYLNNK